MAQDDCRIISVSGRNPNRRGQILLDGVKEADRGSPQGHIFSSAAPGFVHQQHGLSHHAPLAMVGGKAATLLEAYMGPGGSIIDSSHPPLLHKRKFT